MGYSTKKHAYGESRCFWPDDTDTEFFIADGESLGEIQDRILKKWPELDSDWLSRISISSEYIHTDCLGYDLYDSSDYTKFIKITKM